MEIDLDSLLICKFCNNTYNDPIILPCFNSICSNHLKSNSFDEKYECKLCDDTHLIPPNGFKQHAELNMLIRMKTTHLPREALLGDKNSEAKMLHDKMSQLLQKAEFISKEPTLYINEYFSELRAVIDLEREKLIKQIDDEYFEVLKQVEDEEKKCLTDRNYNQSKLDETTRSSREELEIWSKSFIDVLLKDDKSWCDMKRKREHEINKLKYMLDEFQKELLFFKKYKFEPKPYESGSNFGMLHHLEDKTSKDKLNETIHFDIENFKSFLSDKFNRYYENYLVLNQIPWKIVFTIENIDEDYNSYELVFCAYLMPECAKQSLDRNKTKLTIKVINLEGKIFSNKEYSYNGNNYTNRAIVCPISVLMNSRNKIYNKQLDSIKLEIDIETEMSNKMIHHLYYGSEEEQINATKHFRKLAGQSIDEIINSGIVPKLVELFQRDKFQLQYEVSLILKTITIGSSLKTRWVVEANALPVLIKLLSSPHEDIQMNILCTLSSIVVKSAKCRDLILDHGILPPLLELLAIDKQCKIELKRKATGCLSKLFIYCNLSLDSSKVELALPLLTIMILCSDKKILTYTCWAFSYLKKGCYIKKIIDAGIFPRLVELLMHESLEVVKPALRVVQIILAGNYADKQPILDCKILASLLTLLHSSDELVRDTACFIIWNIVTCTEHIQAILDAKIFPKLIEILNDNTSSKTIKTEAVLVLKTSIRSDMQAVIKCLVDLGIISSLCSLLSVEANNQLIEFSLEALENILNLDRDSNEYECKIKECDGLEKMKSLLETHKSDEKIYNKAVELIQTYFEEESIPIE